MSEDVSKFLEQVKELGERRIHEDEARTRELEEKILQDKKERQARRKERARSISPEKSSPANTPPTSAQRTNRGSLHLNLDSSPVLGPPLTGSPRALPSRPIEDEMASTSPTKENEAPLDPAADYKPGGQTSPTRSGSTARGLSWQQRRPPSQAGSRSRPLSMVATENAARVTNTPSESIPATETLSRDQIASALSSKDPTWFRQTADRGANSAAYRKNQVEDDQRADVFAATAQLPGMARERPRTQDFSSLGSPLSPAPKLDPPADIQPAAPDAEDELIKSPTGFGRSSPSRLDRDRSTSPTKGMGGFVQSAMKKRSDSVSKRWSVRSTGLQRADSVATNRGAQEPALRSAFGHGRENSNGLSRDNSTEPSSRPTSSRATDKAFDSETASSKVDSSAVKAQSKSPEPETVETESGPVPVSPSKTMDPRRWSPTKSSWLETALNKPESPKPKTPNPATNQPAWMADLQKAKAQRAANPDAETSRPAGAGHKHQVSIGGLMRSTALGTTTVAAPFNSVRSPTSTVSVRERAATIGKPSETSNASTPKDSKQGPESLGSPFNSLRSPTSTISVRARAATIGKPSETTDSSTPKESKPMSEPQSAGSKPLEDNSSSELKTSTKPKTETPPKNDFRSTLKHRQTPSTASSGNTEPEFKNVFGSLRKTTTQNYKAPDELKDNILRGKAGLALTGGPQKTERRDEFKDAILARKKSFHEIQSQGRGVTRNNSSASEKPVPEGLVKRMELGQSSPASRTAPSSGAGTPDRTGTPDPREALRSRALSRGAKSVKDDTESSTPGSIERPSSVPRRETPNVEQSPASSSPIVPSLQKEASAPGRLQGKVGGSALANRFNPALAGLLARGPPGSGPGGPGARSTSSAAANNNEPGSGPKLTHMTKGRARGPKRKAPTAAASTSVPPTDDSSSSKIAPSEDEPPKQDTSPVVADTTSPVEAEALPTTAKLPINNQDKAPEGTRSIFNQVAAAAAQRKQVTPLQVSKKPEEADAPAASPKIATSPKKLNIQRMSRFLDEAPPVSPKAAEPPSTKESKQSSGSSPVIKPKPTFEKPMNTSSEKSQPQLKSNPSSEALESPALQNSRSPSPALNKPARPLPEPEKPTVEDPVPETAPLKSHPSGARPLPPAPSTPRSQERELPSRPLPSPTKTTSQVASASKQATELTTLLQDFFGPKQSKRDYHADVAGLLMERPNSSPTKIKTLAAHLFQFSADGRKQVVPSHHEHTLFDQEMYLCSHTFESDAGWKNTEVYFWAGNAVPESAIEDASIFVSREAKQLGGNLVKIRQGKETPEFIQALGGIIVTQRGTGNKDDSLAPHMFCGRRYVGQVVFDEVDFAPKSLCSGFPYLVAKGGKCFLWKGKGSNVDELSCARLIGMDYALTGELEEIDDCQEPDSFWSLFEGGAKLGSADHWRLKPSYDKYCSRLFYSDAASKQQVIEISPFSQKELQATGIYVLDAFFELYIIVGSRAQSQYASFHNALDFAQEYAILAAGMEDRPFVPVSTVVLEGAPRDLKSVFRTWRDSESPTLMPPVPLPAAAGSGLKRGRSMRVVTLNQALQALNE